MEYVLKMYGICMFWSILVAGSLLGGCRNIDGLPKTVPRAMKAPAAHLWIHFVSLCDREPFGGLALGQPVCRNVYIMFFIAGLFSLVTNLVW